MLTIALQRIEFDGRHGATAVERRTTRKFEVDVELDVDVAVAERSDLLADTVDYSRVAEAIVGVGTGEPHHLLESLARQMLDAIRDRFPRVRRAQIEVRKLNPPTCPGHPAYAAVRIVRAAEDA
jgi:7,8-dihydroneopterin aldolase/epimerase/oxygenase